MFDSLRFLIKFYDPFENACAQLHIFIEQSENTVLYCILWMRTKEVIKEQPTSRNLSATAARVPQCTCPVAASRIYASAIHTSHHLTTLTPNCVYNIILHLLSVLCTAVNVRNKNFKALKVWWHDATLFIYFYITRAYIQFYIYSSSATPDLDEYYIYIIVCK